MMKIRTRPSRTSPLVRLEETIGHDMKKMSRTLESVDRYTIAHTNELHTCNTPSLHSTGLRLAVRAHKHSNVKLDTSVASGSDDEALQCNVRRSLDAVRSSASASFSVLGKGGTPSGGYGCLFSSRYPRRNDIDLCTNK